MDGIPRITMIAPEMKVADRPLPESFEDKIREYIVTHYQDDPSKFNEAFKEIASMRNTIIRGSVDVEFVCVMKRYYGQLLGIKKRFPMEEGDPLAVPFAWADRALDLPTSLVYEDISFELCCVIFNIAAGHAIIAANESRNDLDSIKNSFMHFQCAAYPIQYLRDQMGCGKYSSVDFETSFLTFYLNVMLAQAQECLLEKSMIDQRKPIVIARVAFYLRDVYKQCVYHLDNSGLSELVSTSKFKTFVRLCSAKSELYAAIGNFYLGHKAEDEKNMGLRLTYFSQALTHIKSACKVAEKEHKGTLKEAVQYAFDVIVQREANARRENDFIYHERVAKPEDLEKVEGVVMVKPIAFDPFDPSIAGEDLFKSLLPTDVIKAISMYSEEKAQFKREILSDVESKDNQLDNYLVSLQLDQLHLDEPIDQMRLPDELLQSSAAFSAQPDSFPDLLKKFDKVMSTASEAEHKLSDLRNRLRKVEDAELQQDEGFKAINAKLEELTLHHVKARSNNAELQRAMASHSENLKLLAMPLAELSRQICGQFIDPMETTEGSTLRKMLDKVDEMRKQRCNLLNTLNVDLENDDIARKALAERELDPKKLFERELDKHSKTISLIKQNMTAQETILKALTEANANFAEFRRQIIESNEHRALQSLTIVTAYQVFMDVTDKTDKALNFYTQLFSFISALSKGVEHIETAKENERREAERIRNQRRAAKEAAEAIKDFSLGPVQPNAAASRAEMAEVFSSPVPQQSSAAAATGNRPRLGDYMSYYRNKMGPAGSSIPRGQLQVHPSQDYSPAQMHVPNHLSGNYPSNPQKSHQTSSNYRSNPSSQPYMPSFDAFLASQAGTNQSLYSPVKDNHQSPMVAPTTTHHHKIYYAHPAGQQSACMSQPAIPHHSNIHQSGQKSLAQLTNINPQAYHLKSAANLPRHQQTMPQHGIRAAAPSDTSILALPPAAQQPQMHGSQYKPVPYTSYAPAATVEIGNPSVYEREPALAPAAQPVLANKDRQPVPGQSAGAYIPTSGTPQHTVAPSETQDYAPARSQVVPEAMHQPSGVVCSQHNSQTPAASPWHQNLSKHNPYAAQRQAQVPTNTGLNTAVIPSDRLNSNNSASTQHTYFEQQSQQNSSLQGNIPQLINQQHIAQQGPRTKSANIMKFVDSAMQKQSPPTLQNQTLQKRLQNSVGENTQNTRLDADITKEAPLPRANHSLSLQQQQQQQPPKQATPKPPTTGIAVVLPIARHQRHSEANGLGTQNLSTTENTSSTLQADLSHTDTFKGASQNTATTVGTNNTSDSSLKSLLDPNTFELGQGDKNKLEKQMLRKEFREHGVEAQLPRLDTSDPLNTLDAHYWMAK